MFHGGLIVQEESARAQRNTLGSGREPVVVLLHGSAGAGAMWRPYERLHHNEVTAPDLIGYGKAPDWRGPDKFTLGASLCG